MTQLQKRLTILIVVVAVIIGVLFAEFKVTPVEDHFKGAAQPQVQLVSYSQPKLPPPDAIGWRPGGMNALAAKKLGPRRVHVPARVRARIIKAVNKKGGAFKRRATHLNWYQKQAWFVPCALTASFNTVTHKRYFRCLSPAQMNTRLRSIRHLAWGCSQTAIITTAIGGAAGATAGMAKRGAVVGAIGSAAGCVLDKALTQARHDLKQIYVGPKPTWPRYTGIWLPSVRPFSNLPHW